MRFFSADQTYTFFLGVSRDPTTFHAMPVIAFPLIHPWPITCDVLKISLQPLRKMWG